MDDRLRQILALYESEKASTDPAGIVPASENADYAELRKIKKLMETRSRRRPRVETVNAVLAAARAENGVPRLMDREARGLVRLRRLRWTVTAGIVILAAVLSWQALGPGEQESVPQVISELEVPDPTVMPDQGTPKVEVVPETPALAFQESQEVGPEDDLLVREPASRQEAMLVSAETIPDEVLAWDQTAEIRRLYEQVNRLVSISPAEDQWRVSPTRRTLQAPVGLARPQHAVLQTGF